MQVQQVSGVTQPEPATLSDTAPEALPAGGQPAEQPDPQPGDQTTTAVKHSTHGWFADHLTLSIQPANLPHVTISSRLIVVTHVATWILFVCACVIRSPCIALTMMYMCRQRHTKRHNSDVAGGGESLTRRPGVCCGDNGAMPPCGEALRHPSPDRPFDWPRHGPDILTRHDTSRQGRIPCRKHGKHPRLLRGDLCLWDTVAAAEQLPNRTHCLVKYSGEPVTWRVKASDVLPVISVS